MTTGKAVLTIGYWVVARLLDAPAGKKGQFVVIDTSVTPHVQVFGPTTRDEAEAHARVNAQLWTAVFEQTAEPTG